MPAHAMRMFQSAAEAQYLVQGGNADAADLRGD